MFLSLSLGDQKGLGNKNIYPFGQCDRFRSTNSPTSLATRDTSHRNLTHLKILLRKSTKPTTTTTDSNYTCNSAIYTKTLATEITLQDNCY